MLRYDDVGKLLRDPRLRQGSYAWPAHNKVTGKFADWWLRILLNRVGDDHARLRRLANPAFSPKLIIPLQPKFAELANDIVDKFAERGRCDFMAEFSEPYATRVTCVLLGLDQSEWRRLADIAGDMGLALGVNFKQDVAKIDRATAALFEYAHRVVEERRTRPPGDDFISLLLQANEDKDALSDQELYDMVVACRVRRHRHDAQPAWPGDEHVRGASGPMEAPGRPAGACQERGRGSDAGTPDDDLGHPRGDGGLHLWRTSSSSGAPPFTCSPNLPEPTRSISRRASISPRKRKPHFGFGGGVHHCLGHFIARCDMTEALKVLARRIRNPRYDGEPTWLPDSGNTGPIKLPIAFDPES